MRNVYKNDPVIKKVVTQGTIINNCVAEKYHCDVYGVVVTPRCDLEHSGKVTHVHYLPIVPLDTWYQIDGLHYLWTRALDRCNRKIGDICKKYGFPMANLKEKQLRTLCDTITEQKDKNSLTSSIDRYFELLNIDPQEYRPNVDEKNKLVENLHKGDIPAFMLIEDWEKEDNYRVILLRDLKRVEYNIAVGMASGIEEKSIVNKWRNDLAYSVNQDTIYNMEAEIISPFIEQLMERFSYNFCRIGVEDMDENVEDILKSIIK